MEHEPKYEVIIRIPVNDEYIAEAKAAYPHLSLHSALKKMLDEENKFAEENGDPGRSELREID